MNNTKIIGPFTQIVPLSGLSLKGSIADEDLTLFDNHWITVTNGKVESFDAKPNLSSADEVVEIAEKHVLVPGLVDCHTHMIWGGNRAQDYSMRMAGKSYQEILANGGGIFDSVRKTQEAASGELMSSFLKRANRHIADGVTTAEVKSGYGLEPEHELKILETLSQAQSHTPIDIIATCLAAHVCPKDKERQEFLDLIIRDLLPTLKSQSLAKRVDIFVEDNAFPVDIALPYLQEARRMGFDITVHADQFTTGGSELAVQVGALSADHLEASGEKEIKLLAASDTVAVALPGASLGLGMQFTPARKLLDAGASLAISTDWNPGSAPMGDLLVQASLLGIYEKLSSAELLAGITFRAAQALGLSDRGILEPGKLADMIAFPLQDFREIFYNQGKVKPDMVWKKGVLV
ncbi:imidazolonepropionase [Marinoscillum sp.]|uniref:imidazolonepropionase n=1 Tax=Marinoscillum sp. TaxID=2024838 RepID=UPI003BA9B089